VSLSLITMYCICLQAGARSKTGTTLARLDHLDNYDIMAAASGPPMEAAEASCQGVRAVSRSCHSTGSTIAHDVLDVDSAFVSSSASFKQKSTIGVMLAGTTVDNIVIGGLALRLRRRPSFNS
jgi:hypothetical protein